MFVVVFALFSMLSVIACIEKKTFSSPPGYNLNQSVKYNMPEELTEVSGIAFHQGNRDMIYAEQDEKGHIYYFKPGSKDVKYSKFGKSGDYEDVAVVNDKVVILRSDGVFFVFPLASINGNEITNVKETAGALPQGEYEGLSGDDKTNTVYALCKNCADKSSKITSVYSLTLAADGTLKQNGKFSINVKDIDALAGKKKGVFRPSALAKNPLTGEWYILSSVNRALVVADANWKVKATYPLNPELFMQPEGMAFDSQNNLYISNEGDEITAGNVLKFNYKK
jgi:hypothetical protein